MYYYFGEIRKVGASHSAIYTTVLLLVMMVMLPLGGWVSDRLIPRLGSIPACRTVAVAGMVLSAALLYVGTNIVAGLLMVALLSLALGLAATAEGPFWAALIDTRGQPRGRGGRHYERRRKRRRLAGARTHSLHRLTCRLVMGSLFWEFHRSRGGCNLVLRATVA